jgi:hypothetical protein
MVGDVQQIPPVASRRGHELVSPMIWIDRLLRSVAAAALIAVIAPAAVGLDEEGSTIPPSCVHELVYEPFSGLILVSVTIADSPPLDFVLDSGATQSSVTDPILAWALGLEIRQSGLARGIGAGAKHVVVAEDIGIQVDGIEVLRAPIVVHDIGARLAATAGREIHGFLGADLFEKFVIEIDPRGRRLLLHDPETFDYRGPGSVVPLEVSDRRPIVTGTVIVKENGKEVPVRLLADTGSSRSLALITKSRRHLKPPSDQRVGESIGVVGNTTVVIASTNRVQFGSIIGKNIETAWMEAFNVPAARSIEDLNGILGNQLLGRFRAVFDYRGGRLILEPLSGFSDASYDDSD